MGQSDLVIRPNLSVGPRTSSRDAAAESGEFGPVAPGLEATVRIAQALLEHAEGEDDSTDE